MDPGPEFIDSYRGLVSEFEDAGEPAIPFVLGFPSDDVNGLLRLLDECGRGEGPARGWVPHSTYWLIRDDTDVVGVSNLRHRLTDELLKEGGHIGYGIRPSERGRRFAGELLSRTLDRAWRMGLERVLLTCAKSNTRSVRTILSNDGILDSEEFSQERGEVEQRYWIEIPTNYVPGPTPTEGGP